MNIMQVSMDVIQLVQLHEKTINMTCNVEEVGQIEKMSISLQFSAYTQHM